MKKYLFNWGGHQGQTALVLLWLRVTSGGMMLFGHGLSKWEKIEQMKAGFPVPAWFQGIMTPSLALWTTLFVEIVCSALLMLGLLTRPAALMLGFTMLTAAFCIHVNDPFFLGAGAAKEPAILYLIPYTALIFTGAGKFSLDRMLQK